MAIGYNPAGCRYFAGRFLKRLPPSRPQRGGSELAQSFDVIDGPSVCLFVRAVVVHFGPSVDAGHYRALLFHALYK